MKHRLFLPALMCCLTLAAFGFFVFAHVYESMWPEPFAATWLDFICAIVFSRFAIRYRDQGIGGRLFPLWILTILHMLLFPLLYVIPPDFLQPPAIAPIDNIRPGPVYQFLVSAILVSPLVLFLFALIYGFALSNMEHTDRPLKIAFILFAANVLVQGLIAWSVWVRLKGG